MGEAVQQHSKKKGQSQRSGIFKLQAGGKTSNAVSEARDPYNHNLNTLYRVNDSDLNFISTELI
jgi:hypothetical protein